MLLNVIKCENLLIKSLKTLNYKKCVNNFRPTLTAITINNRNNYNYINTNSYHTSSAKLNKKHESGDSIYSQHQYTSSDAHLKHKAYQNFRWSEEEVKDIPTIQRPVLVVSMGIFLLYFAYLREPNDLDERMGADLFDLMPHLQIPMIESAINDAELIGTDTVELRKKLQELKELKEKVDKLEATKTGN